MKDEILKVFNTPRDENRIGILLDLLGRVWERYPDVRFGQLIINLGLDEFYKEDDVAIAELRDFLDKEYDNR